jgi:hypothetical protein
MAIQTYSHQIAHGSSGLPFEVYEVGSVVHSPMRKADGIAGYVLALGNCRARSRAAKSNQPREDQATRDAPRPDAEFAGDRPGLREGWTGADPGGHIRMSHHRG